MLRLVTLISALSFGLLRSGVAQTVVESTFLPAFGAYSEPANWSPAEVPNNTEARKFNLTLGADAGLDFEVSATVSNVRLSSGESARFQLRNQTFVVTGTTAIARPNVDVTSNGSESSRFNAGALSSFLNGALTGDYTLQSSGTGTASLQFRGAKITTLRDAALRFTGAATQISAVVVENLDQCDATRALFASDDDRVMTARHP